MSVYLLVIYIYLTSILLIESTYNPNCGCSIWKCDNYTYNTSEYETCVNSNGCTYCSQCSSNTDCSSDCDMQTVCNNHNNNNDHNNEESVNENSTESATTWWLLAGLVMGTLFCIILIVTIRNMIKILKDDEELVMLKMQRKQSHIQQLALHSGTSDSSIDTDGHINGNKHRQTASIQLSPVVEPHSDEFKDDGFVDIQYDKDTENERKFPLDRVKSSSEYEPDEETDHQLPMHVIKISRVDSSGEAIASPSQQNNKDKGGFEFENKNMDTQIVYDDNQ